MRDEMKLRGIATSDAEIIRAIDQNGENLTNMKIKKDGEPAQGANVFSEEELKALMAHTVRLTEQFSQEIFSGEIAPRPYIKKDQSNACTYCDYKSICTFDTGFTANQYRNLEPVGREQIVEKTARSKGVEDA
jgi:ATP-dependent helicase/nuclease subunit B